MRSITTLSIAAMLAAGSMTGAMAQTFSSTGSTYASKTAEGSSDTKTLAIESNTEPGDLGFGEFGIFDFSGTSSTMTPSTLSFSVDAFSGKYGVSGPLDFFLTSNTAPLTYAEGFESTDTGTGTASADGPNDGIDPKVGTLTSLGSAMYVAPTYTAGAASITQTETYTFALSSAAQSLLAADLKAGDVKLIIGAPTGSTTSTEFDGTGYVPAAPAVAFTPTMTLTPAATPPAVPEASTTISFGLLLALGLGAVAVRRRKVAA